MTSIDTLREATTAAADVLTSPGRRASAYAYLEQRGIDAGALGEWTIGYAPPGWTRLVDVLHGDFAEDTLLDAGLARRSSRGTLIDAFRDRVMFGVRDDSGALVGFVGRDLSGDRLAPKYLNSSRSDLFDKSSVLFGLWEGQTAGAHRQPVVVEGPLDVLAIAASDRKRALVPIAPCGTAFTRTQADKVVSTVSASGSGVVVAMDADAAGRTAAINAGESIHLAGAHEVRIASLPNGTDPAEFLTGRSGSLDAFSVERATPLFAVQVERAIAGEHDRMQWIEGRVTAARSIARTLTSYPTDFAARQIGWVAEALHLDVSTITNELVDAYRVSGRVAHAARSRPEITV